jgi:hypothetical protein
LGIASATVPNFSGQPLGPVDNLLNRIFAGQGIPAVTRSLYRIAG